MAGLKQRILKYRADPSIETQGRAHVASREPAGCNDCGEALAWLHGPDMATGGHPADVLGKGLRRNNSIIGGQATVIADEILRMPDTVTHIEWELILIKARVRVRP